MRHSNRSRWPIRDILALAIIALCILVVLAALIRPGTSFDRLLALVWGLLTLVIGYYFRHK
jgi:uncharacterized membrane protein